MDKAKKLRDMMEKGKIVRVVGAHNGLTARLVERNGFDAVWAGGLEVSASYAIPDASILTMTEYLQAARIINDAVSIPVIVDCDTGYGNSNNVIEMVKKFEAAGIAAVCIEDKLFPKVNSFIPGRQELAPISEFVGKIMAAKNTQKSKDFMVIARIEALIAGWGQEEALKRAHAYAEAGADAILIHSKSRSPEEVINFIKAWDGKTPIVLVPTTYNSLTLKDIEELEKIKIVIYANHGMRAAITAINKTLQKIRETGATSTVENEIAEVKDIFELQNMIEFKELESKYLKTGKEMPNVIIPAAGKHPDESLNLMLKDTPLTMLDVNGKSILRRNVEMLRAFGMQNITVITGFNGERIVEEGIERIHNEEYDKKHILHSIMKAKEKMKGKTLLVYSDILFEKEVLERLLKSEADITLVIDRSYKNLKNKERAADVVVAKHQPIEGERTIQSRTSNPILRIGQEIPREEANFEFIGMALFSEKGVEDFKKAYEEMKEKHKEGRFNEAESFDQASFVDLIQKMINEGHKVDSVEINGGWAEVKNFQDYKHISRMLAEQEMR